MRAPLRTALLVCAGALAGAGCSEAGASSADSASSGVGGAIVTVGSAVTEIVFALGEGGRVVGTDSSGTFPVEAEALPHVGYQRTLTAEPILALGPALVLASEEAGPPHALEQLRAAGVRVVVIASADTAELAAARIRAVGDALGRSAEGAALAEVVAERSSRASADASARPRRRVLFLYARGAGSPMVSGADTGAARMLALAGAENACDDFTGYRPLSSEALVAADPEVIVLPDDALAALGGVDGVCALPGVGATRAGRARAVASMDDALLLGFGPRLGEAIEGLARSVAEAGR